MSGRKRKNHNQDRRGGPFVTIWKRPAPAPPAPATIRITHTDCGTSWEVPRGASAPTCPRCSRLWLSVDYEQERLGRHKK